MGECRPKAQNRLRVYCLGRQGTIEITINMVFIGIIRIPLKFLYTYA